MSPSLLVISDQNDTNSLFGKLTILIKMGFGKEKKVSIITNRTRNPLPLPLKD